MMKNPIIQQCHLSSPLQDLTKSYVDDVKERKEQRENEHIGEESKIREGNEMFQGLRSENETQKNSMKSKEGLLEENCKVGSGKPLCEKFAQAKGEGRKLCGGRLTMQQPPLQEFQQPDPPRLLHH